MNGVKTIAARIGDAVFVVGGALLASKVATASGLFHGIPKGLVITMVAGLAIVLFPAAGVYQSRRGRSIGVLVIRLLITWLMVQLCMVLLLHALDRVEPLPAAWIFSWTVLTGALMVVSRVCAYMALDRFRDASSDLRPVAVIGKGANFARVLRSIEMGAVSGFRTAVIVDLDILEDRQKFALGNLPLHLERSGIHDVWIALELSDDVLLRRCIEALRFTLVNIRLLPDVTTLDLRGFAATELIDLPSIDLSIPSAASVGVTEKELFDRLFAVVALTAIAPILIGVAVAVKLSSPGPILFRQRRKGLNGRPFTIYKFRTMRLHTDDAGTLRQATRNDPRVTVVGRFLRRTSLDELPQFFNVLRGEMSVVGPRPHALEHDNLYSPLIVGYIDRYRAKPGITGWAQINGFRGETDRIEKMVARVEYDLYYLKHWSFALDMKIIFVTLARGFFHIHAY
jgi:putative colanic acid biosynthesis UDP-glucose lipid carrier transferase